MLSGWQRLGVVISLLWLIAAPAYLLFDQNTRARDFYGSCRGASRSLESEMRARGAHEAADVEHRDAHDTCWSAAGFMSAETLLRDLVDSSEKSRRLWAFLIAPIALFWIAGSAALSTARWVFRGFRHE
jgi:hypothetical protein